MNQEAEKRLCRLVGWVGLTHGFVGAARLPRGPPDRRAGMVGLAPVARLRAALNFIGAMSGPVTMKSPLTTRMVSVVIAATLPDPSLLRVPADRWCLRVLELEPSRATSPTG